jgi:hypothetical protein
MIGNGGLWSCNVLTWAVLFISDGDGTRNISPTARGLSFSIVCVQCISECVFQSGWVGITEFADDMEAVGC